MTDEKKKVPATTKAEAGFGVAATLVSALPWLGGPLSNVLTGMATGRKFERVQEVLDGMAEDLAGFTSAVSEEYVRRDEFEDLLGRTLRQVAEERNEQKRRIYRVFLSGAIKSPGEPYDEQLRFLRTLENLQGDHIRVVRALLQTQERVTGGASSPLSVLESRLPGMRRGEDCGLGGAAQFVGHHQVGQP